MNVLERPAGIHQSNWSNGRSWSGNGNGGNTAGGETRDPFPGVVPIALYHKPTCKLLRMGSGLLMKSGGLVATATSVLVNYNAPTDVAAEKHHHHGHRHSTSSDGSASGSRSPESSKPEAPKPLYGVTPSEVLILVGTPKGAAVTDDLVRGASEWAFVAESMMCDRLLSQAEEDLKLQKEDQEEEEQMLKFHKEQEEAEERAAAAASAAVTAGEKGAIPAGERGEWEEGAAGKRHKVGSNNGSTSNDNSQSADGNSAILEEGGDGLGRLGGRLSRRGSFGRSSSCGSASSLPFALPPAHFHVSHVDVLRITHVLSHPAVVGLPSFDLSNLLDLTTQLSSHSHTHPLGTTTSPLTHGHSAQFGGGGGPRVSVLGGVTPTTVSLHRTASGRAQSPSDIISKAQLSSFEHLHPHPPQQRHACQDTNSAVYAKGTAGGAIALAGAPVPPSVIADRRPGFSSISSGGDGGEDDDDDDDDDADVCHRYNHSASPSRAEALLLSPSPFSTGFSPSSSSSSSTSHRYQTSAPTVVDSGREAVKENDVVRIIGWEGGDGNVETGGGASSLQNGLGRIVKVAVHEGIAIAQTDMSLQHGNLDEIMLGAPVMNSRGHYIGVIAKETPNKETGSMRLTVALFGRCDTGVLSGECILMQPPPLVTYPSPPVGALGGGVPHSGMPPPPSPPPLTLHGTAPS